MRRPQFATALIAVLAIAGCNHSKKQSKGITGVGTLSGMVADPVRELVYLGDSTTGRVFALSTADGTTKRTLVIGASIGGLALDHCMTTLYVAVSGANRIDQFDCDTFTKTGSLALGVPPFALAGGANGHLYVVTSVGLLDVDPATLIRKTMKTPVSIESTLVANRFGSSLYMADSSTGFVNVTRFDLIQPGFPTVTSQPGAMQGAQVGVALNYAEDELLVGTSGPNGVFQLDAETLAVSGIIPLGPDLAAVAVNPTGTRLYFSHGDTIVDSINLDPAIHAPGASFAPAANVRRGGLAVGPNGLSLLTHEEDKSIQSYFLFDVQLNGPGAVRQTRTYTASIDGFPNAVYYLLASGDPGYVYIDKPTKADPRFLDLALGVGFQVLGFGQLDANGHVEFTGVVPDTFVDEATVVFQAAVQRFPGKLFTEIGNPLLLRFMSAECSK